MYLIMNLILTFALLLLINNVSTAFLKAECNPKYRGYLVQRGSTDCLAGVPGGNAVAVFSPTCFSEYSFCEDGSLRRVVEMTNLEECIENGETLTIKHINCNILERDEDKQKWKVTVLSEDFIEPGGIIKQKIVKIQNMDNKCLTRNGENLVIRNCETNNDKQQFYFRSRGQLLKKGKLYNRRSEKCLKTDNVPALDDCSSHGLLKYYKSGEIVTEDGGCLGTIDGTEVTATDCKLDSKQKWDITNCNKDDSCLLINKGSSKCLQFYKDEPTLKACVFGLFSFFDFVNGDWDTSKSEFVKLGCNQDGKITVDIQNEVTYGEEKSNTVGAEVSATVSASPPFVDVSVSATASFSLAKTWNENYGSTVKSSMSCENYEDSINAEDKFTHGCMWQLKVTTFNRKIKLPIEWRPPIVKCTRSSQHPKCNVFMKCADRACEQCIPENEPVSAVALTPDKLSETPSPAKNKKTEGKKSSRRKEQLKKFKF